MTVRRTVAVLLACVVLWAACLLVTEAAQGTIVINATSFPAGKRAKYCATRVLGNSKAKRPERAMTGCLNKNNTIFVPGSPTVETETASFISTHENDDVLLTCTVKNKGGYTVSWMLGGFIPSTFFHDTARVNLDRRFRLETDGNSTFNLQISRIRREDDGVYVCQVNTLPKPTSMNFTLQVVVPPRIVGVIPQAGSTPNIDNKVRFAYNETDDVILSCEAEGKPKPTMKWLAPGGRVMSTNAILSIPGILRDDGGLFRCTADNGYLENVQEQWVEVIVQFKPEVTAYERDIRCGKGDYRQLRCRVRSIPPASYTWTKDNQLLNGNGNYKNSQTVPSIDCGNTTSFVLMSVKPDTDYGIYRCYATNLLGTTDDVIEVSGRLRSPKIVSNPTGNRRHSYGLTWLMGSRMQQDMASYSPIDGYILSYYGWWFQDNENGDREKVYSHSSDSPLEVDVMHDPEQSRQVYVLRDLRADVTYEVMLRGYNRYGDGDNVTFTFRTAKVNTWTTTTTPSEETPASKGVVNRWKNAGSSAHRSSTDTAIAIVFLFTLAQFL